MRQLWTADLHFGHANIIKYTNRPYPDVHTMNESLVYNWNRKVKSDDLVYIVGDFCFKNSKGGKEGEGLTNKPQYYINRLNGIKVFVKGNHDRNNGLKTCIEKISIRHGNFHILMVHDPKNCDMNFPLHICGHVHEKWKFNRAIEDSTGRITDFINVGVDVNNFMPVTWEEIFREYKYWLKIHGFKLPNHNISPYNEFNLTWIE